MSGAACGAYVRRRLRLGTVEPEHDYPPRVAEALGATFPGLGAMLFVRRVVPPGLVVTGAVVARQRCSRPPGSVSAAASASCGGRSRRSPPGRCVAPARA
jgi:hypothetical protein